MKLTLLGILGLSVSLLGAADEAGGDWREELLKEEGIGLSRDALEKALSGERDPVAGLAEKLERLSAADFSVREKARAELLQGGKPAMKWLENREPSADPEVRRRVTEIIASLAAVHRKEREVAMEHAMRSLLLEGGERTGNTGGLFYEWFGEESENLGKTYRGFDFQDQVKRGGKVRGGSLLFPGKRNADGDQRLILKSGRWLGEETFGRAFLVSVYLGGEDAGAGAWHLGVTIGKVRALFHPGMRGGSFRFEKIGDHKHLSPNQDIGFIPGDGELQRMLIHVRTLENGNVRLAVILAEGGAGKERFETSIDLDADVIGALDQVSLDRSGRNGGAAIFRDFSVELLDR